MIAQIFAIVALLLKVFGLWEQFGQYMDDKREKERVARDQARDAAVDKQKEAQTEEDFDKAQDAIAGNTPRP